MASSIRCHLKQIHEQLSHDIKKTTTKKQYFLPFQEKIQKTICMLYRLTDSRCVIMDKGQNLESYIVPLYSQIRASDQDFVTVLVLCVRSQFNRQETPSTVILVQQKTKSRYTVSKNSIVYKDETNFKQNSKLLFCYIFRFRRRNEVVYITGSGQFTTNLAKQHDLKPFFLSWGGPVYHNRLNSKFEDVQVLLLQALFN